MKTIALIIATILTIIWFFPLLFIQTIRRHKDLGTFHYNLAKNIDYMWASLIFGTDGHTVSAMIWKKYAIEQKSFYFYPVSFVDWLFRDPQHCLRNYNKEFKKTIHL